ncbi:MAG: hypothetical protein PHY30_01785 [Candidatus Pacebacteria bacterium]|nr:hypothetical protein [Candidatus Paceibacterota bacterium]
MFINNKKLLIELYSFIVILLSFNFVNVFAEEDNIPPIVNVEQSITDKASTYTLTANEALSFLKVELSKNLYVILHKNSDTDFEWQVVAQKDGGSIIFADVFKDKNDFSLKYAGSEAKVGVNQNETQFTLEVIGPIAKQLRSEKNLLVSVKDIAQNEVFLDLGKKETLSVDKVKKGYFNQNSIDYPLRVANVNSSKEWMTNLNVSKGDKLKFCVYYHNSSNIISQNTALYLSFNEGKAISTISSDNFNSHVGSLIINQDIELDDVAKWYHNYNGKYEIDDLKIDFANNGVMVLLGDVNLGYSPNDGYVIFSGTAK